MFDINAATQACQFLISLSGGSEDYRKIFQMLYLADRKSIFENYISIFGDRFERFVVFNNNLKSHDIFSPKRLYYLVTCHDIYEINFENGNLSLRGNIETEYGDLSEYDIELLTDIYNQYKDLSSEEISEITDEFRENKYTGSFDKYQVMEVLDIDSKTIEEIKDRDEAVAFLDSYRLRGY